MAETKQKRYNGKILGDTSAHLLLPHEVPSTFRRYSTESGTDVKSVTINMASTLLLVLPFACYARREQCWLYIGVVAISFLIAFLLPPVGWKRPHPYSDMPENRPKLS
jgi:hypothetical protein